MSCIMKGSLHRQYGEGGIITVSSNVHMGIRVWDGLEKFITYPLSTTACQDKSHPPPRLSTYHRCNFLQRQGDLSSLIFHINHLSPSINSIECPWQSHLSSAMWEEKKQTDRDTTRQSQSRCELCHSGHSTRRIQFVNTADTQQGCCTVLHVH